MTERQVSMYVCYVCLFNEYLPARICTCVHLCISTCCKCVHVCTCMCASLVKGMYVCMNVCMLQCFYALCCWVCTHIHARLCVCTYNWFMMVNCLVNMFICMYVGLYVCLYVYMYIVRMHLRSCLPAAFLCLCVRLSMCDQSMVSWTPSRCSDVCPSLDNYMIYLTQYVKYWAFRYLYICTYIMKCSYCSRGIRGHCLRDNRIVGINSKDAWKVVEG